MLYWTLPTVTLMDTNVQLLSLPSIYCSPEALWGQQRMWFALAELFICAAIKPRLISVLLQILIPLRWQHFEASTHRFYHVSKRKFPPWNHLSYLLIGVIPFINVIRSKLSSSLQLNCKITYKRAPVWKFTHTNIMSKWTTKPSVCTRVTIAAVAFLTSAANFSQSCKMWLTVQSLAGTRSYLQIWSITYHPRCGYARWASSTSAES